MMNKFELMEKLNNVYFELMGIHHKNINNIFRENNSGNNLHNVMEIVCKLNYGWGELLRHFNRVSNMPECKYHEILYKIDFGWGNKTTMIGVVEFVGDGYIAIDDKMTMYRNLETDKMVNELFPDMIK